MEIYTTKVAAAPVGAAYLGVCSPWANLAAAGAKHALAPNAVLAVGTPDARRVAFRPDQASTPQSALMSAALMSAQLLPTANNTQIVHKTRINAGGYGAMGPHPEREQPA